MSDLKLASAGDDIKLWDCNGFTYIRQFNPHGNNISSLCWSTDNKILASASVPGDKIVLSYSNSGAHTREIGAGEKYSCIAFNSTSRYVMGGKPDGVISLWDIKTDKLKRSYKDHKTAVTCLQFNWNDTYIASGSEGGEIILYNVVNGVSSTPMVTPKIQAVRRIEYSHYKKSLLGAVSDDGAVSLWDTIKHRLVHSFTDSHKAPATGLAFSPINEMLLLSVGLDKRIVCYDVQGKSAVRTMTAESPLTSVTMLHDGTTLAVGSMRGKIYIYDLRKGSTPIQTLAGHKSSVQCLVFQNNTKSTKNDVGGKVTSKVNAVSQSGARSQPSPKVMNGTDPPHIGFPDKTASDVRVPTDCYSPLHDSSSFTERSSHSVPPDFKHGQSPPLDGKSSFTDGIFSPLTNNTLGSSRGHSSAFLSHPSPLTRRDVSQDTALTENYSHYSVDQKQASLSSHTKENEAPASLSPSRGEDRIIQNGPTSAFSSSHPKSSVIRSPSTPTMSHQKAEVTQRRTSQDGAHERTRSSPASSIRSSQVTDGAATLPPDPGSEGAVSGAVGGLQPFHARFLRNLVEESLEEFREEMRANYLNLHMEIIRQFVIQKNEIEAIMSRYSVNNELLAEVERLREENKQLKKKF